MTDSIASENLQDSQEEVDSAGPVDNEHKEKLLKLPLGRVRNIVKMDPDVNLVNQEALFLITKSAVIFHLLFRVHQSWNCFINL